jgi:hypothetical protein
MQTLITGYPDLQAVFVQNEDMALGAIKALEEAGKLDQVQIVSQNGAPYGLESIAAGGIKATVGWSPSQEAALAFRLLVEHLQGEEVPKLTITPMKVITRENVNEAVPWEPTEASTKATLELDIDELYHEFAMGAGFLYPPGCDTRWVPIPVSVHDTIVCHPMNRRRAAERRNSLHAALCLFCVRAGLSAAF